MLVVSFLLGGLVVALILRRPGSAAATAAAKSAAAAAESAAAAQRAADAVSAAARAATRKVVLAKPTRATTLASFHSALVRLEARRSAAPTDALPVDSAPTAEDDLRRLTASQGPQDAVTVTPEPYRGERFHFAGSQSGKAATEEEYAIDWPEPGAVAVAEITARVSGKLSVIPMTRTPDRIHTHEELLRSWGGKHRERHLLTKEMTHLKVRGENGRREWSIRLLGPSDLDELTEERQGHGREVLAITGETPIRAAVRFNAKFWQAMFVCGCWTGPNCACPTPEALEGTSLRGWIHGADEGADVLVVPRPGLLVIEVSNDDDPWMVRTQPLDR